MKHAALLPAVLAAFLTTFSAFAYEEARLTPDSLVLHVGEWADVRVAVHHVSGLNMTMYGFHFSSDRRDIAMLDGTLDYVHPVRSGMIHVMALAPGITEIVAGGRVYATVEVVCGFTEPVRAVAPVVTAKKGDTVKLAVTSPEDPLRVLRWYEGRVGDYSRPLPTEGTDLELTPTEAGTHYAWASAKSPCSSSSAEFRIEVLPSRRRAVGR